MTVSAVGATQSCVAFKGKPAPGSGGAGKAWTSAFIPGLGQFLDGRNGAGTAFMAGNIGLNAIALFGLSKAFKAALKNNNAETVIKSIRSMPKVAAIAAGAATVGSTALYLCNIVDAYKGRKNAR